MHIFRIFGVDLGHPARLVFDSKPQPAPGESANKNPETAKEKPEEAVQKSQEERAKLESQVKQQELKEKLGEGPAEKYIETFRKFSRTIGFEALTATLEAATELRAGDVPFNFEDWQTLEDQQSIAAFIEEGIAIGTFPGGEGSKEFLAGLKLYPQGATKEEFSKWEETNAADFEKWKESNRVLGEMAKILKEHFEVKKHAKVDTSEQAEKKPFGMKTISDGVKTLMKNFKRGDAMEKTAILGAIGIGIYILYKYKDSQLIPFWKKATVSKTLLWIGAGLGVNYLTGKVSPDGKTVLQRLDLFKDIDELHDENVMKAFAIKNGMDEDQEKLSTFYKVLGFDVRRLYELYRDSKLNSVSTGKKEIDPKQLGFYKGEVDGKALYEIIENLVKFTAVNEQTRRREEDAKDKGIEFVKPTATEIAAWESNADAAFEEKYFNGPMGAHKQTLFDAIMNEYRTTNWQSVIAERRDQTRPRQRAGIYAAEKLKWAYEKTKDYGGAAAGYVWVEGGKMLKTGWNWSYDNILKPIGSFADEKYTEYKLHGLEGLFLRSRLAVLQEQDLNKVLPAEFAVTVTDKNKAEILGLPEIPFEIKEREQDDKVVAIIDGIEFLLDDGLAGNSANATKLESKIKAEVEKILQNESVSNSKKYLQGKKPDWKPAEKKWVVDNVEIENDQNSQAIGLNSTEQIKVSFTIEKDRKTLKFFEGKTEIKDFDDIAENHRGEVISEQIRNALKEHIQHTDLGKALSNLPITDLELRTQRYTGAVPSSKPWIEGKIAGLQFTAELKNPPMWDSTGDIMVQAGDIRNGIEFCDEKGAKGGKDKLKIDENRGGKDFLRELSSNILKDSSFSTACLVLRAQMENAGEGVWERLGEFFKTRALWIIPTNPAGLINGKILQNQWLYTLEYKKFETIELFEGALLNKNAIDIESAYAQYITGARNQLNRLSKYIASFQTDKQKADNFTEFLSGKGDNTKKPPIPCGLEYVNYPNEEYRQLFAEYKAMLGKYNYKGLESVTDLGTATEALETYQYLWRIWFRATKEYSVGAPLTPAKQQDIRTGIDKIRQKLDIHQQKGPLTKADLPPAETKEDIKAWIS